MELKHTPGPWEYGATAGNHDFAVYSESEGAGRDIALVRDFDEANAKLIATAPALLTELDKARQLLERLNTAFYVGGTAKTLRPVMAETKPALQSIRATLAAATIG